MRTRGMKQVEGVGLNEGLLRKKALGGRLVAKNWSRRTWLLGPAGDARSCATFTAKIQELTPIVRSHPELGPTLPSLRSQL
jgi:hypothetical protein